MCIQIPYTNFSKYETKQDPAGPSQVQKFFRVPCFLFVEEGFGLLGASPESQKLGSRINDWKAVDM